MPVGCSRLGGDAPADLFRCFTRITAALVRLAASDSGSSTARRSASRCSFTPARPMYEPAGSITTSASASRAKIPPA